MPRILVIGGTSGIGKQIVESITVEFGTCPFTPDQYELDVTTPDAFPRYFTEYGPFEYIVYSAGMNELMPLGHVSNSTMEDIFDVNVMGFIRLLDQVAIQQLSYGRPKSDEVSVVAIVSDAATTAMRHSIAYASSKAALAHAIRCGARELATVGVRVNGVAPSTVADTPMTDHLDRDIPRSRGWTPQEAKDYELSLVPMKRRCTKIEVAQLVIDVLNGPEFMTGAVIPLTGGK